MNAIAQKLPRAPATKDTPRSTGLGAPAAMNDTLFLLWLSKCMARNQRDRPNIGSKAAHAVETS